MDPSTFLALSAGILGTWIGAELLVRGSVRIALGLGLSPLLVGLTVVALGTSAPEAVVSFIAARGGASGLSLGNVLGSNVANIGLILGIVGLLRPLEVRWPDIRRDAIMMGLATVLGSLFIVFGWLDRWSGFLLLAMLVLTLILSARDKHLPAVRHDSVEGELDTEGPRRRLRVLAFGMAAAGLAALIFGAQALISAAVTIARDFGIDEGIIGATMVAVGTSLPELAASIVAVLRGHHEIGIGNIVGSNLMNLLFVLGGVCTIAPIHDVPREAVLVLVPAMTISTALFIPMLSTGRGVRRREGVFLLLGYAGFAGFVYF